MWIEVRSPHTGRPVRIRDKDVGRTVRDEEGHIFFVLPQTESDGYYASLTRTGGPEQEANYFEMIEKENRAKEVSQDITRKQIHDATGKRRKSSPVGKIIILLIIVAAAVVGYLVATGKLSLSTSTPSAPAPANPGTPDDSPAQGDTSSRDTSHFPHHDRRVVTVRQVILPVPDVPGLFERPV